MFPEGMEYFLSAYFADSSESFQMAWKVSRWPLKVSRWPGKFTNGLDFFPGCLEHFHLAWNFPDSLNSFEMAWKVSRWPGKFSDDLESFHMAWKISRWPGKFPDDLESFQMTWKVSRWPEKFPDFLDSFLQSVLESLQMIWKVLPQFVNFYIAKLFSLMSEQLIPKKKKKITKTFQVYKNFPGRIATLLPWFFCLWV